MTTATQSARIKPLDALAQQIRRCTKCPLHQSRTIAVPGEGPVSAPIMFIGEAPGRQEDQAGRPFVGSAGKVLSDLLQKNGIARAACFITSVVKCRPPENRLPTGLEVTTCTTHYLAQQITLINPKIIVLLGGVAAKTLLGISRLGDSLGRLIEHEGRTYLITHHPAAKFYRPQVAAQLDQEFSALTRALKNLKRRQIRSLKAERSISRIG